MSNARMTYREVRYLIHDHSVEVYVRIRADGDCPLGVHGWHYRHFVDDHVADPSDILPDREWTRGQWSLNNINVANAVMWPQQAPPIGGAV